MVRAGVSIQELELRVGAGVRGQMPEPRDCTRDELDSIGIITLVEKRCIEGKVSSFCTLLQVVVRIFKNWSLAGLLQGNILGKSVHCGSKWNHQERIQEVCRRQALHK